MSDPRHQKAQKSRPDHLDPHRFYGRRKGPRLTAHQEALMGTLLPRLVIPLEGPAAGLNPFDLFDGEVEGVAFEVGFGKGEHLAAQAKANPDWGFIGCEPYLPGVASLLSKIDDAGLTNIRLYTDDARHILRALTAGSVQRLFLLHPDPWPKRRHAKRRFVGPHNLDLVAHVLADGGLFRVGTDHPDYRQWTAMQMALRPDFVWTARAPHDWLTKPKDWPDTRYEEKALEGEPVYLGYRRLPRAASPGV